MAKWKKQTLKLKKNHGWKARPGYRIFVADRAAVRFDIPQGWVIKPDSQSVKLYDGEPPDDNCRLEVSHNRLPPIDWDGFDLPQLLRDVTAGDSREVTSRSDVVVVNRPGLRLVWAELSHRDPVEDREAYSRVLIGIGGNVQCLITMDYWPEDAARARPVWDDVVGTLQLGVYIPDPTTGNPLNPRLN
ncbi:MAG TPA: hypothetical protein VGX48_06150 [Pyrinomonadaceae bacterium]|jgi:hypothetical protein|nr:hypothetical protein [Pyrinomonadaceae bacterium]